MIGRFPHFLFLALVLLSLLLLSTAQPPRRWAGGGKARRRRTSMIDLYGRPRVTNGRNPVDPRLPVYHLDRNNAIPLAPYAVFGALDEFDDSRYGKGWRNIDGRHLMI